VMPAIQSDQSRESSRPRRRLSNTLVRLLFLFALPLLVAQMLVSRWWDEPFPAIMMPRFTHQTVKDGVTTWKDVRITLQYEDGTQAIIDKNRLLDPLHLPQRNMVLGRVFGPNGPACRDDDVRDWLSTRVTAVTGRHDVCWLHLTWFEVEARFAEPGKARWDRVLGRRTIDLKRDSLSPLFSSVEHVAGAPLGSDALPSPYQKP
jgi:hypothetical protein